MTVIIRKTDIKNLSKILTNNLDEKDSSGKLTKHFGKLKRDLDGLKYQSEIRKDEN